MKDILQVPVGGAGFGVILPLGGKGGVFSSGDGCWWGDPCRRVLLDGWLGWPLFPTLWERCRRESGEAPLAKASVDSLC